MRVVFLFILLQAALQLDAQRICGTGGIYHPASKVEAQLKGNYQSRDTVPDEVITIPVVVHIIYNNDLQNISEEQVLSQLAVLNNDFRMMNADAANVPDAFKQLAADSRMMFCLARVDPSGRPTKGIIRRRTNVEYFLGNDGMKFTSAGGSDAWDTKRYLNIWVCSMFGRSLGYATLPGAPPDKDGVVINYDVFGTTGNVRAPFNLGRTASHEVAHWMGLKHIWGDENCGDDEVDDTPLQKSYNYNCPSFPHVSACSPDPNGDMFMNFMDLTNDACMNMFTHGQKIRMRSVFATGGLRNEILNSQACDGSLATGAPLPDTVATYQPEPGFIIYPNPVQSTFKIMATNGYKPAGSKIQIYSSQGKKVKEEIIPGDNYQVDINGYPSGMYLLNIVTERGRKVYKIMKL